MDTKGLGNDLQNTIAHEALIRVLFKMLLNPELLFYAQDKHDYIRLELDKELERLVGDTTGEPGPKNVKEAAYRALLNAG